MKTITLKRAISLLMVPIFLFATYFSLPAAGAGVTSIYITIEEDVRATVAKLYNGDAEIAEADVTTGFGTNVIKADEDSTFADGTYTLKFFYEGTDTSNTYGTITINISNGEIESVSGQLIDEQKVTITDSPNSNSNPGQEQPATITMNNLAAGDVVSLYKVFDINANGDYVFAEGFESLQSIKSPTNSSEDLFPTEAVKDEEGNVLYYKVVITDNELTVEQYNAIRNALPTSPVSTSDPVVVPDEQDKGSATLTLSADSTEGFYVAFVESSENIYNPIFFNIGAGELDNGFDKGVEAKGEQPTIKKTAGRLEEKEENGQTVKFMNEAHKSVSDGDTIRYQIIADMPPYQYNKTTKDESGNIVGADGTEDDLGAKGNLRAAIAAGAIKIEDILTQTEKIEDILTQTGGMQIPADGPDVIVYDQSGVALDEGYYNVEYAAESEDTPGKITITPKYKTDETTGAPVVDTTWDNITQIKIEYDVVFDGSIDNQAIGPKAITSGEATLSYTEMPYSASAKPLEVETSSEADVPSNTSTMYTFGVYLMAAHNEEPVPGIDFEIKNANVNPAKISSATTPDDIMTGGFVFIGNFGEDYTTGDPDPVHSVLATKADGYVLDSNARSFTLALNNDDGLLELTGSDGLIVGESGLLVYMLTKELSFTATGGPGTIIFLTMGAVLVGCSALFFVISRKKERQQ